MKLSNIAAGPPAHDIDANINVMPAINQQITRLKSMLALLPGSDEACAKLDELESMLVSRTENSTSMIEMQVQPPTILDYDASKVLGQQRVHIHGVSSTLFLYLPGKVSREAGFVADMIAEIDSIEQAKYDYNDLLEKYRELNHWTDQLARTANTLSNAAIEMARLRQIPRTSQQETAQMAPVSRSEIDRLLANNHVMAMYETMKVGLGDRAWVAINKRLRAQGLEPALIESMINRAIVLSEQPL